MPNLTKRTVDAATVGDKDYFVWCGGMPGFGVRIYPTGRKVFLVQVRIGRQTRRLRIGNYGPFTVDQARDAAREIIRNASLGKDPQREKREARQAITVAELCDCYMEAARANLVLTRFRVPKRQSTVKIDEGRVQRHIKPLIGQTVAKNLTRFEVQRMVDQIVQGKTRGTHRTKTRGKAVVKGGPGTAARAASLLGGIYTWGERRGLIPGPNPVRGVETARYLPRDRVASTAELRALGRVMEAETAAANGSDTKAGLPPAIAALKLIALTGLRREEAVGLRWAEIDEGGHCLRLAATKTGKSVRPIGEPALALLRSIARSSQEFVFANEVDKGSADLKKRIAALFDAAGLQDVRSHDLRRTFASAAADEGYSDATIAALLGHTQRGVTARHYIRRPDEALVAAANRTSHRIANCLAGTGAELVSLFAERS